jgi:hypothetical protein
MSDGESFYTTRQAAEVLCASAQRVHKLIEEGNLEAYRDEETDRWLVNARSVHALRELTPESPEAPGSRVGTREGNRSDLWILTVIAAVTLLAAGYTLLPALLGGQNAKPQEVTAGAETGSAQPETTTGAAAPQKTTSATVAPVGWVSAVGDSVMLGAADALSRKTPNLGLLNAQGSRQPPAAIDVLRQLRAAGHLGDAVVVHVGNKGPFTGEQFDEMMRALRGVRKVLIVNLTVPPGVEDPVAVPNNAVLDEGVKRYPNAVLVDWRAASANHPEFFGEDETHLTFEGAQAYADLIATYLEDTEGVVAPPGPQETVSWGEGGSFGECVGPPSWCIVPVTS